jgi:hypothetical protein
MSLLTTISKTSCTTMTMANATLSCTLRARHGSGMICGLTLGRAHLTCRVFTLSHVRCSVYPTRSTHVARVVVAVLADAMQTEGTLRYVGQDLDVIPSAARKSVYDSSQWISGKRPLPWILTRSFAVFASQGPACQRGDGAASKVYCIRHRGGGNINTGAPLFFDHLVLAIHRGRIRQEVHKPHWKAPSGHAL